MAVNWRKYLNRIPNFVRIDSRTKYEVVWIDDFADGNTLGETRYDPPQIVLKKGLSPKNTVITYLHEIMHCASDSYNIELTESQILNMEGFFYYCLKNGNLFKGANRRKDVKRKKRKSK